jgi:hypothetical protein
MRRYLHSTVLQGLRLFLRHPGKHSLRFFLSLSFYPHFLTDFSWELFLSKSLIPISLAQGFLLRKNKLRQKVIVKVKTIEEKFQEILTKGIITNNVTHVHFNVHTAHYFISSVLL